MEWSTLDPAKFELIVRDNSQNKEKCDILSKLVSPTLKLHTVENCNPFENAIAAFREASGDFILSVGDDDWLSIRGLQQLHAITEQYSLDTSIACVTGNYLLESTATSYMFRYGPLDSKEPHQRISNYLQANASNFLYYSVVRRSLATLCFEFLEHLPYRFSYHDQLISLIYLSLGRVIQIERVVYGYDLGEWETAENTLSKDRSMYVAAGLPVEYDRLHHFFCALEGALLLDSNYILDKVAGDTGASADLWFQTMFSKFVHHQRDLPENGSASDKATTKLRQKLLTQKDWNFSELLLDACDVIEVADPAGAQRYFNFWSTL
jgi:hypothetical protein